MTSADPDPLEHVPPDLAGRAAAWVRRLSIPLPQLIIFDMLDESFASTRPNDDRAAIITPSNTTTWREMAEIFAECERILCGLDVTRIGLVFPAEPRSFATLAALARLQKDVFLMDVGEPSKQLAALASHLRLEAIIHPQNDVKRLEVSRSDEPSEGSVTILTSGTSGRPKAARHSWPSLTRPVRRTREPQRWLMAYRPHLYAGLQVALQALLNRGTLIVPDANSPPEEVVELMMRATCDCISATPSYWRRLLLLVSSHLLSQIPLKQITLGGEVVDQPILDQLSAIFPAARLVHIYATTEMGRCFSVTDRRAGFPCSFLQHRSADGIDLRIDGNELLVRSANAMDGYDVVDGSTPTTPSTKDGWYRTGDLVEIREERVFFAGRTSDLINVGGNKVHPVEVEQIIRELNEVAEVRVYAKTSSLAGELVACDVLSGGQIEDDTLRAIVIDHCNQRLNRYQRPRIVNIVDQLDLSPAGKLRRADVDS